MKKLKVKVTFITNFLLVTIFSLVCALCFVPESIEPIYGGNRVEAIYHASRDKNNVCLLFNVYENSNVVKGILQTLENHGAKATFFVGGCWADDNGDILNEMIEGGHEIANHGYFHKDHKKLGEAGNREEITLTGTLIKALCGVTPTLFAPPSGSFSSTTLEVASTLNYKVIMWSKDTIDWRDNDENLIYKRATNNVENGDFILMHPKSHTLNVLPKILEHYNSLGFNLVTVSQSLAT